MLINQCMYLLISFSCNIQTEENHLVRLPQRLSLGQRMVILAKMLVQTNCPTTLFYIFQHPKNREICPYLFLPCRLHLQCHVGAEIGFLKALSYCHPDGGGSVDKDYY